MSRWNACPARLVSTKRLSTPLAVKIALRVAFRHPLDRLLASSVIPVISLPRKQVLNARRVPWASTWENWISCVKIVQQEPPVRALVRLHAPFALLVSSHLPPLPNLARLAPTAGFPLLLVNLNARFALVVNIPMLSEPRVLHASTASTATIPRSPLALIAHLASSLKILPPPLALIALQAMPTPSKVLPPASSVPRIVLWLPLPARRRALVATLMPSPTSNVINANAMLAIT